MTLPFLAASKISSWYLRATRGGPARVDMAAEGKETKRLRYG